MKEADFNLYTSPSWVKLEEDVAGNYHRVARALLAEHSSSTTVVAVVRHYQKGGRETKVQQMIGNFNSAELDDWLTACQLEYYTKTPALFAIPA